MNIYAVLTGKTTEKTLKNDKTAAAHNLRGGRSAFGMSPEHDRYAVALHSDTKRKATDGITHAGKYPDARRRITRCGTKKRPHKKQKGFHVCRQEATRHAKGA